MTPYDHLSSTARGLLMVGGLKADSKHLSLTREGPFRVGDVLLTRVLSLPPEPLYRKVEVIEVDPTQGYSTREVEVLTGAALVMVLGGRYSTKAIWGTVPAEGVVAGQIIYQLNVGGVCGCYAEPISPSSSSVTAELLVEGAVALEGKVANLGAFRLVEPRESLGHFESTLITVLGTDMDVGKTTVAAALMASLRQRGLGPIYIKGTGTGRYKDLLRVDRGQHEGSIGWERSAYDFVDAGLPATGSASAKEVCAAVKGLLAFASDRSPWVILELADSPFDEDSLKVLSDPELAHLIGGQGFTVYACDCVASTLSVGALERRFGFDLKRCLISGPLANTPLSRLKAEELTGRPAAPSVNTQAHLAGRLEPEGEALLEVLGGLGMHLEEKAPC